jgi:hypothetical protein
MITNLLIYTAQADAVSPTEFRQWCDEQGTPDYADIMNLLDLMEIEVNADNVALDQALRMQAIADQAIIAANRRALATKEVF